MIDASKTPTEEAGEVEKACQICRVLWPEDALDQTTGICPDCKKKYDEDDGA